MFGILAFSLFTYFALKDNDGGKSNGGGSGVLAGIAGALATALVIKNTLKELGWIKGKDDSEDQKAKDGEKKDNEENNALNKNKALALFQKDVESKKDDTSEEANELRETYNNFVKCAFDENGNERKPEDFEKEFDKLPNKIKDNIKKRSNEAMENKESLEQLKTNAKNITNEDAAAAVEKAKGDRAKIAKEEKLKALEEEFEKNKENKSEAEIAELKKEYEAKKEAETKKWDAAIEKHYNSAKQIASTNVGSNDKDIQSAEKKKKELEDQKKKLESENVDTEMAKQYLDFEFKSLSPGDLTGVDENKKKEAEAQLEKAGLSKDLYLAVQNKKFGDEKVTPESLLKDEKIKKSIEKEISTKKEKLNNEIQAQDDTIAKLKNSNEKVQNTNDGEPKKDDAEPKKDDAEPKKDDAAKSKKDDAEPKKDDAAKSKKDDAAKSKKDDAAKSKKDDAAKSKEDDTEVKDKDGIIWIKRKKERGKGFTYFKKGDKSVTISQKEYNKRKRSKNEHVYISIKDYLTEVLLNK